MSYLIDKKLAQVVINYLGKQPYDQVFTMIKGMESMHDYDEIQKTLEAEKNAKQPVGDKDAD